MRKASNALEALQAALTEMETMLSDDYVPKPKVRKTRTPHEATQGTAPKKPGRPKKTA